MPTGITPPVAGERIESASGAVPYLFRRRPSRGFDLRFDRIEVEARALLHRRKLDRGHRHIPPIEAPETASRCVMPNFSLPGDIATRPCREW